MTSEDTVAMSEEQDSSITALVHKAANDKSGGLWEKVAQRVQECSAMPTEELKDHDKFNGSFDFIEEAKSILPPKVLKGLILLSGNDEDGQDGLLQTICNSDAAYTLEHIQIVYDSNPKGALEMHVQYPEERYERNNSALMLLLEYAHHIRGQEEALRRLQSAHFLATKCPALLHIPSFGDKAGDHFQGELRPMSQFPLLAEKLVMCTKEDATAIAYLRDYWIPVHDTWCDEIGVADDVGSRFLRMLVDLCAAGSTDLLDLMCEKKMWDVSSEEAPKVWRGVLKSGLLCGYKDIVEAVLPILGAATPECIAYAQEKNAPTTVIHALVQSNPDVCADVSEQKPSKKAKTCQE